MTIFDAPPSPGRPTSGLLSGCHRPRFIAIALIVSALTGAVCPAVEPAAPTGKPPDFTTVDGLLLAGDYERAAAVAEEIAPGRKPKPRANEVVPRTIDFVAAKMRKGFAELRLGRLDAAEDTLEDAHRAFKDDDFKRLFSLQKRQSTSPQAMARIVPIDLGWIDLLNLRMMVVLERLRFANVAIASGGLVKQPDPTLRGRLTDSLEQLDACEKEAAKAREELRTQLDRAGDPVLKSPRNLALTGNFQPTMVAAIRDLELGRLASGGPAFADLKPADGDVSRRFAAASAALDEAMKAAAPQGPATLKPDARAEAAVLRAELLVNEAAAALAAGDPAGCNERVARAMALQQEAAGLRRIQRPDNHPDLFWPLLLTAEARLEQARLALRAGDPSRSRTESVEAAKLLARANELPLPKDHPLRSWLAFLESRLTAESTAIESAVPGSDAAAAAARRVRRAIDATGESGGGF